MRILIDATTWVPGRTGIGLYTERLLRALSELTPTDELLLASNVPLVDVDIPFAALGPTMPSRAIWLQSAMALHGRTASPDVAFFPNYMVPLVKTCPTVVTVHDMAVFLFPDTFTFKKRVLQRALLPSILRRADAILTPSESTRADLLRLCDVDPARVVAIHLAADPRLAAPLDERVCREVRAELGLPDRYLLAVSTLEPRKNLVRLVDAFARVAAIDPDVKLVLVGGKGWRDAGIRQALSASPVADRIMTTGYVTFDALRAVYRGALAMCYPSLYEGFGLPVIEAMACGAPVLTSRGSSLDEVAQDAALKVDPLSVDEIAAGMIRLVQEPELRQNLIKMGLSRSGELSWERTARLTRQVFADVAGGRALTTKGP